ncbi:hypothetical protein C6P42_004197 [Pichia californica]|nr:hypothetical protein C6P42_004197 [[Candida] californica]
MSKHVQEHNSAFSSISSSSSSDAIYANDVISFIKTPENIENELNDFVNGDFKHFSNLTISNPSTLNQKIIPRNFNYSNIKNLNEILNDNKVKKALELVKSNFNQGRYLSFIEFQNLFIQFLPFQWYAYKLLKLYEFKFDYNNLNNKILIFIMKISYLNFDFKLFHKIFKNFQLKNEKLPIEILMYAIQIYLKTENIQIATQLFNQYVMSEINLPERLLDLFISNLYNKTKNLNLCLISYKLWLSKNLSTNLSIDSFIYNLILDSSNLNDIKWIENSLIKRNLFDKFIIKFGNLCNELSRNYENYNKFIINNDNNNFKKLALIDNELSSYYNNLTYLHLRHKNYKFALNSFQKINNRKDFQLTIYSIIRHFENNEKPELIFKFLKNLKINSNYKIHWSQILIYWRSLIKKYPNLGYEIDKNFKKSLKKSKFHRFGFLSKLLLINKQFNRNQIFEITYYPIIKYDNLEFDLKPLNVLPKLINIESRLFSGILPNNELLRKSIKITNNKSEFNRLVEISNKINLSNKNSINKIKNLKLNLEIFFKDYFLFNNKLSIKLFINDQINLIKNSNFKNDEDLCEIFKICVKFNLFDESLIILKIFKENKIQIISNQNILKFLSMFIKWCWINKKFKDLIIILEWLKNENNLTIDKYFWLNLKEAAFKNIFKIEHEINIKKDINKNKNLTTDQLIEIEKEREFINNILPHLINYYDSTLEKIILKSNNKNDEIIKESYDCFLELIKWVDQDTEILFEGDW